MRKIKAFLIAILIGCFSTENLADITKSYEKSCKNCKENRSDLVNGYFLTCECRNWDKKYIKSSLFVEEECYEDKGGISNCNGKLMCTKKCPKKKFLGLF